MKRTITYVLLLVCCFSSLAAKPVKFPPSRQSSAPYISGDTFRAHCDFLYDETYRMDKPEDVKEGNTIFIKTDFLDDFFKHIHPKIPSKYIIVTHNGDLPVPREFDGYLNDDKIIAWFGQNVENYSHSKLHPIPIGIANRQWPHGDIDIFTQMIQLIPNFQRNIMLYMNFSVGTYFEERNHVVKMFQNAPYCLSSSPKDLRSYLSDLAQAKFVLSPRGNGLDCHRTWESLLMGAIPIVRTSTLDPMFEDLPVLVIQDWSEINEEFLNKKYAEMQLKTYQLEKIYASYWLDWIDSFK